MALTVTQMADLITSTLRDLGRLKLTDLSYSLQDHVAAKQFINKNRIVVDGGTAIQWQVKTDHANNASWEGLYGTVTTEVGESLISGYVDWRHIKTSYAFDEREPAINAGAARIVDLIKDRRGEALTDWAERVEAAFWSSPDASSTVLPYGLPYWIVKNNSTGFNGGAASGYTTVGNINPTTYTRWKNYTAQYTAVSKDDLIPKWRKAATLTNFKPPYKENTPSYNTGDNYAWYMNYDTVAALENLLEAQNENLGKDVASMDGKAMFRGRPCDWVPYLDADTTNPIYGVNWGVFKTYVLKGFFLKELTIPHKPGQPNVSVTYMDTTMNWVCKDRRRQIVLATNT